jgi:hypothetical protein
MNSFRVLMPGLNRRLWAAPEQCDAHAQHENEESDEADVRDTGDHRWCRAEHLDGVSALAAVGYALAGGVGAAVLKINSSTVLNSVTL